MKFNIHAGHNPDNKIACGAIGIVKESTVAREITRKVISILKEQGHTAYDCTCNNGTSAMDVLKEICKKSNSHTVDLDVSIHLNASNGKGQGVEVLVYNKYSKALDEAKRVVNKLEELGYKNRGVKYRDNLYILKHTKAPCMLIECFFCDNEEDVKRYNVDKVAKAIVEGILNKTITSKPKEKTFKEKLDDLTNGKYPTLKKGSRGGVVKLLQQRLYIADDGIFGSDTDKSVKAFQKKKGLTQDGIVGKKTWNKLV